MLIQIIISYQNFVIELVCIIQKSLYILTMNQNSISVQAQKYYSEDFKNLYRYIKTLSLLNSLYLSEAISQKQFEQEQNEIQNRYSNIVSLLTNLNKVDFQRFAELYGIQTDFKRIKSQPKNQSDKKVSQVVMMLTSKIIEINDSIHAMRTIPENNQVKYIVNVLCQVDMLLKKFKQYCKKASPIFLECMNKFSQLYQIINKKSIHQELSTMELYDLEDLVTKLKLHFEQYFSS